MKLEKIHKDNRGEIYLLKEDLKEHKEITLLITKKGFARGGCIHRLNNEFNTVLEGQIRYFNGEDEFMLKKGDTVKTPSNIPHYFISLTDSLVIEWGCDPKEKSEKYKPFRDIVNKINEKNN